ncbi:MAG: acetyl-CoA carboxylase, biotin carboxyl carrier protein [Planctomycetes bacterium]|nr:acetyl-CoA carboxylase, biotin carboxyl carrier protein [Planctomycetota bacterium]
MTDHDLAEVDLKEADQRIRLRKGSAIQAGLPPAPVSYAAPPTAAHPAPAVTAPTPATQPPVPTKKLLEIKSELVGAFYTRPSPDKPEYVKVGSKVNPDTTVCVVVAMKVNNEIKAGCSGTIVEVVAKNEDYVEFNAVLFRVDPG